MEFLIFFIGCGKASRKKWAIVRPCTIFLTPTGIFRQERFWGLKSWPWRKIPVGVKKIVHGWAIAHFFREALPQPIKNIRKSKKNYPWSFHFGLSFWSGKKILTFDRTVTLEIGDEGLFANYFIQVHAEFRSSKCMGSYRN